MFRWDGNARGVGYVTGDDVRGNDDDYEFAAFGAKEGSPRANASSPDPRLMFATEYYLGGSHDKVVA